MEKLKLRLEKYTNHVKEACGIDATGLLVQEKRFLHDPPEYCIKNCPLGKNGDCDYTRIHMRNCKEAEKWDGRYTYYCPKDLIFIAAHCVTASRNTIGIIAGPIRMEPIDKEPGHDEDTSMLENEDMVPVVSVSRAYHIGEIVAANLTCCGFRDRGFSITENRWDIVNKMFEYAVNEQEGIKTGYSIEVERRIQYMIKEGDKEGALQLSNMMIALIKHSSDSSINCVRTRMIELIVLISRVAIEAGAEANSILILNEKYISEIFNGDNIENLGDWLITAVNTYVTKAMEIPTQKYSYSIYKVINYVKQNYAKKITLDEVSKMTYLSKSYFSKMFSDEMGITFSNYITKVRIEKSKQLLLDDTIKLVDVGYLVGFIDQSYFIKCFKKLVGVSPGKYRKNNGIIEVDDAG